MQSSKGCGKLNVAFIGNTLLDFTCENELDGIRLAEKYHLKKDDNCEAEAYQLPLIDELLARKDTVITPGGSAQNSARITKYVLNQSKQTTNRVVYFMGCIGDDKNGQLLSHLVQSSGVVTLYDKHATLPTGVTSGLVTSPTTRSLMAHIGAAAHFDDTFLESDLVDEALKSCEMIYLEGYFLSHSPVESLTIASTCSTNANNCVFAFGLSANYIVSQHFEELMHLLPYCDLIFANKSEAVTFVKQLTGEAISDIKTIAQFLVNCDKKSPINSSIKSMQNIMRIVMITQGQEDVVVAIKRVDENNSVSVITFPVPSIDIAGDTIGAGDAFVGGVIAGILQEVKLDEAVLMGIDIAGKVCQSKGCVI